MKEKGTLLVVGSLLALSLATVTTARAAGTLNFTGKIINESCQIANNGGDVNVDFGNVDMSALKSHEAKTAETPVSYTHLDVYKRQLLRRIVCARRVEEGFAVRDLLFRQPVARSGPAIAFAGKPKS